MEVKKYNPLVVMNKHKPKAKPKTKLEAKGLWRRMEGILSQENKKKLDIIYAKGFVKTCKK